MFHLIYTLSRLNPMARASDSSECIFDREISNTKILKKI
jgi:hypothetical protein